MRIRLLCSTALVVLAAALPAQAQNSKGDPKDKDAIAKSAQAFVDAFHKGDAKSVAGFWTADGDFTDQNGNHLHGRAAIEQAFKHRFAEHPGRKLRIDSHALRFVTPQVAIEDGTTHIMSPDGGPPTNARYTIVHVKKEGTWLVESVREAPLPAPSNFDKLSGLSWMIGDWDDQVEKGDKGRVSFMWAENQNFIVSNSSTSHNNATVSSSTQWIGWDPSKKHIRSWTFDGNGGFGEAIWVMEGDKLVIKATTLLPDGRRVTATNTVTRLDEDTVLWQSRERSMDGQPLPGVEEMKMKRRK